MLRKNRIFAALLFSSFALLGCNSTREYTEYNYSSMTGSLNSVQISASMIGKYEDVSGSNRETLRKNPYHLSIGLLDSSSEFVSAKIVKAEIRAVSNGQLTTLSVLPAQKTFAPSFKSDGNFAGFLAKNIELNEVDCPSSYKMAQI